MIKILILSISFLVHRDTTSTTLQEAQKLDVFDNFKSMLIAIREQKITPDSARLQFKNILQELHQLYPVKGFDSSNTDLIFPLRGISWRSIGGQNGSGYRAAGFDLFDAKKKSSHPAHDIFINDSNQDCVDDRLGTYVDIVSVSEGLVIATETNWQVGSEYRGGNYVWVYDFRTGGLWYYAHQRKVIVQAGQRVHAGEKLGEVGRTGFNAYPKRSPTHLHLMYLRIDENNFPHAVNTFSWLKKASCISIP